MTVSIVVAMGANGVIGVDGDMPWHLPADLAHFKRVTLGHPMIMGRKTFDSIGRALPGRTTIVVTRQRDWQHDSVRVASSTEAALALAQSLDPEVFVVGGAQVYADCLRQHAVDRLIVTHIDAAPEGDTYFPVIDWTAWTRTDSEAFCDSAPPFTISSYTRS